MNTERPKPIYLAVLAVFLCVGLLASTHAVAESHNIYTADLFELGDGVDPATPGDADIMGTTQPGPDWDDLFNADRSLKDAINEFGAPGSNGVPDFLDTWGSIRARRDVAFIFDTIADVIDPADDLGNAYAYTAFNDNLDLVVYAGVERLLAADSDLYLEFNKGLFSTDEGGAPVGARSVGDILVKAVFSAGILSSVEVYRWEADLAFHPVESLPINPEDPAEQCNTGGTLCTVCNGSPVDGGSWDNFDSLGNPITTLEVDTFMEVGINLGRLLNADLYSNYYNDRFTSLQISTPTDYALGTFMRAGWRAFSAAQ